MSEQATADDKTLDLINQLVRKLFKLRRKQVTLKQKFDEDKDRRKAAFESEDKKLEAQISKVSKKLRGLVKQNRGLLITRGKSFATLFGKFSYRDLPSAFKVTDKVAALKVARKLGILRKVCSVKVTYSVETDKLEQYLNGHPEHHKAFEDCIEWPGKKQESLSVKPNDTYLTRHDSKGLTAKGVTLGVD